MKFAFIQAEKAAFKVVTMCRVLGVTRQGYYAYAKRGLSPRALNNLDLMPLIKAIFEMSGQTYGSPRVLRELRNMGVRVGKTRVERLMQSLGLTPPTKRRHVRTTVADEASPVADNVLNREFTATAPNQRWVTDITYIWTDEGWAYLAAIIDLFSRAVVGWALSESLATTLPLAALESAITRRGPVPDCLHHSDRGSQYTSQAYRDALEFYGFKVSMSGRGECWDNAVAESFFGTVKREFVGRHSWKTRYDLHRGLFQYIEDVLQPSPVALCKQLQGSR